MSVERTLNEESVPEQQLLQWFEQAVAQNRLDSAIRNQDELDQRLVALHACPLTTNSISRKGLSHAKDICNLLKEADQLSSNNSVALAEYNQMRPDLVLFTESAEYLLVELKTRSAPERQSTQELLAYSAAIKMAMPYVNDFVYIIVAGAWNTLLSFSTRALILDGKRVLPLKWTLLPKGDFALDVRLDLFEFNFIQPYDPYYAMETSTFAVARPLPFPIWLDKYFRSLMNKLVQECGRRQQSGFAIIWAVPEPHLSSEILSITLATVNQHWLKNENSPGDVMFQSIGKPTSITGLIYKKSKAAYKRITANASDDDFWTQADAAEAVRRLYPQNSLSYELIERNRDRGWELEITVKRQITGDFEQGGDGNLNHFTMMLQAELDARLVDFIPFGELHDFARQIDLLDPHDVDMVLNLLAIFREHKNYQYPR